ncbi:MAG: hypothetical protein V7K50_21110 [Nostoc sp.]
MSTTVTERLALTCAERSRGSEVERSRSAGYAYAFTLSKSKLE